MTLWNKSQYLGFVDTEQPQDVRLYGSLHGAAVFCVQLLSQQHCETNEGLSGYFKLVFMKISMVEKSYFLQNFAFLLIQ
jgi:hypothetical protein